MDKTHDFALSRRDEGTGAGTAYEQHLQRAALNLQRRRGREFSIMAGSLVGKDDAMHMVSCGHDEQKKSVSRLTPYCWLIHNHYCL